MANQSSSGTVVTTIIALGILIYNGFVFWENHTDSGATHFAKKMINESLEDEELDITLDKLELLSTGTDKDAFEVFSKDRNQLETGGKFFRGRGTFSDGSVAEVCYYRFSKGGDTYVFTGLCRD